eukprot:2533166-Amphidinium_carterae.1
MLQLTSLVTRRSAFLLLGLEAVANFKGLKEDDKVGVKTVKKEAKEEAKDEEEDEEMQGSVVGSVAVKAIIDNLLMRADMTVLPVCSGLLALLVG